MPTSFEPSEDRDVRIKRKVRYYSDMAKSHGQEMVIKLLVSVIDDMRYAPPVIHGLRGDGG